MSNPVILSAMLLTACLFLSVHAVDSTLDGSRLHTRQISQSCIGDFLQSNPQCTAIISNLTSGFSTITDIYDFVCDTDASCSGLYIEFFRTHCYNSAADLTEFLRLTCARNASNIRCGVVLSDALSTLSAAISACNASIVNPTIECAPECNTLLETLRVDYGCCVNNAFNNTYIQIPNINIVGVVSYELWSRCNVPTLEFCPIDSSTDSSTTDTMPTDNAIIPDSSTAGTMPTDDAIVLVVAKILYAVSTIAAMLLMA